MGPIQVFQKGRSAKPKFETCGLEQHQDVLQCWIFRVPVLQGVYRLTSACADDQRGSTEVVMPGGGMEAKQGCKRLPLGGTPRCP